MAGNRYDHDGGISRCVLPDSVRGSHLMAERPIIFSGPMVKAIIAGRKTMTRRLATSPLRKCQPGDRLWVREAFARTRVFPIVETIDNPMVVYRECDNRTDYGGPWKPSIHMPRSACRVMLEVTGVKVERLQDITNKDALAEGALESGIPYVGAMTCDQARVAFSLLWDSLHGKLSWEQNPEVVAISFKRVP